MGGSLLRIKDLTSRLICFLEMYLIFSYEGSEKEMSKVQLMKTFVFLINSQSENMQQKGKERNECFRGTSQANHF